MDYGAGGLFKILTGEVQQDVFTGPHFPNSTTNMESNNFVGTYFIYFKIGILIEWAVRRSQWQWRAWEGCSCCCCCLCACVVLSLLEPHCWRGAGMPGDGAGVLGWDAHSHSHSHADARARMQVIAKTGACST